MPMTLKEHRNLRHMPRKELAALSGVSSATLRRIEEGGYKSIKPLTIQNVSNALNVPPQEIAQFAPFTVTPS